MIERLADDHENARRLAEALSGMDGIGSAGDVAQPTPGPLDPARVTTNFVVFKAARDRGALIDALARRGVLVVAYPHDQIRAVTHYGVEPADIETAIGAFREALDETAVAPAPASSALAGTAA